MKNNSLTFIYLRKNQYLKFNKVILFNC